MALSDTSRIAIVEETVAGVTPVDPAFQLIRSNSDSISPDKQSADDPELNPNRTLRDVIPTNLSITGAIETGLAKNQTFEMMLEGVCGDDWDQFGADRLYPGNTIKTFTIEKRYLASTPGEFVFHRYRGVSISSAAFTINADQAVAVSWAVVGGQLSVDTAEISGATYAAPSPVRSLAPLMRGQDFVGNFSGPPTSMNTHCFNQLAFTLNSQNFATQCLGDDFAGDLHLGKFVSPITGSVTLKDNTIMDRFLADDYNALQVALSDRVASPAQNTYTFLFPRVAFRGTPVPTPGTGELVVQSLDLAATTSDLDVLVEIQRATA